MKQKLLFTIIAIYSMALAIFYGIQQKPDVMDWLIIMWIALVGRQVEVLREEVKEKG